LLKLRFFALLYDGELVKPLTIGTVGKGKVMDIKTRNRQIYCDPRKKTGCSQNDWARLFTLTPNGGPKHRQKGQSNVGLKETGKKGVSLSECLASELLQQFAEIGYDIKNIDFDESGRIISIPKMSSFCSNS